MNLIDVAAVLLIGVTALLAWRAGLVAQAFGLLGAGVGIAAVVLAAPLAADFLDTLDPLLRPIVVLLAFFLAMGIGQAVGGRVAAALRPRRPGALQSIDSLGGGAFGLLQGIVFVWLIGGILVSAPFPRISVEARQSTILRELDARLPSPVSLMGEIARVLDATGLPEVFAGIVPAPPPGVEGPEGREAEQIAATARASTVRVEANACLQLQTGTGFSIAPGTFITNAHVVAGSADVELSLDGRLDRHDAEVVLFDPTLDLAVLHAPGLELPALSFADEDPERGDRGASLGHTGGGRLRAVPAVVNRTLGALGLDIYGRATVRREIVELRADVAPGDSGGPLLLADGTVGGVIFSESRTDRTIGYALTPSSVADALAEGGDLRGTVDTGTCRD